MTWSAHLSLLYRELPYLERPRAAAASGFRVVETWWPPQGLADAWADEVRGLGLAVAAVNSDGGDLAAGDRGFLNVPERREESLAAFGEAVALARRCGAPAVNVLVGRDTGRAPRAQQLGQAASVLAECAKIAGRQGIIVLVEPINEHDVPGYLVPTLAEARALIESVAADDVRLLFDAYHVARAGGDPSREVGPLVPLIGHVQYADCPGRGAPGTGTTDLHAFVEALERAGYRGAIGLEFDPGQSTPEALRFLETW